MSEENKSDQSEALKGVVKWFNDAKGFGFIEHTSGRDVFVHFSVIESEGFKTLKDGEEVIYQIKEGPKGLHAAKVQRVNPPKAEETNGEASNGTATNGTASKLEVEVIKTEQMPNGLAAKVDEDSSSIERSVN